jgi:RNA polymerase sigma-70 factor (ECF subfamily)
MEADLQAEQRFTLSAGKADEALDKAGFTQQALSAADAMHRVASGILREAADREDAVQQALQKAWEKRHTLREPAYFDTWLIRILINECNSILRVKKRVIPMDRLPETAQEGMPDITVRDAVMRLPKKQRLCVLLHYIEGWPTDKVARALKVPASTVRGRLYQARQALRLTLGEGEADEN